MSNQSVSTVLVSVVRLVGWFDKVAVAVAVTVHLVFGYGFEY